MVTGNQVLIKYELPKLNTIVTSNYSKTQWKGLYTKAINSYWTGQFVRDIKSKKSLCYLPTNKLRSGTVHSVWKGIEEVRQVKRCIIKARVLTGTYTMQAQHNVFSGTVDPTCPYCQLEPEDLRHMLCHCPAYQGDITVLRVLVCPDFIDIEIPELVPVISKIENLSRDFIYNIHVKRLRLKQTRGPMVV